MARISKKEVMLPHPVYILYIYNIYNNPRMFGRTKFENRIQQVEVLHNYNFIVLSFLENFVSFIFLESSWT